MATLSITVPDGMVDRVVAALKHTNPQVDVDGLTPGQAAKKIIVAKIRSDLLYYEKNDIMLAAMAEAELEAETIA